MPYWRHPGKSPRHFWPLIDICRLRRLTFCIFVRKMPAVNLPGYSVLMATMRCARRHKLQRCRHRVGLLVDLYSMPWLCRLWQELLVCFFPLGSSTVLVFFKRFSPLWIFALLYFDKFLLLSSSSSQLCMAAICPTTLFLIFLTHGCSCRVAAESVRSLAHSNCVNVHQAALRAVLKPENMSSSAQLATRAQLASVRFVCV